MKINGSVIVVTGAGDGIGREVTLQLLAAGASVAGVDRSEDGLERTAELAGEGARLTRHVVDVTDIESVTQMRKEVLEEHDQVDGLVNIAGIIHRFAPVSGLSLDEIARVMNVNFWGVVHTTTTFLPDLLERPAAALVNVSSMGALAPVPGQTAYGASKAAVKLFTEGLYAELVETNVAVTVVFPGGIGTSIVQNSGAAMPGRASTPEGDAKAAAKLTTPHEAARQIVAAVAGGPYRVRIGRDVKALDVLSRFSPRRATEMIAKKMASLIR